MNHSLPNPEPVALPPHRSSRTTSKRAIWGLAIGIAGLIYLVMVLFIDYYSPLFGLVLIVLAAYEVVEPRCAKRGD
jgi:hypothetical protein